MNPYTFRVAVTVPPYPGAPDGKTLTTDLDISYLARVLKPPITVEKVMKAVGLAAEDLTFQAFSEAGFFLPKAEDKQP